MEENKKNPPGLQELYLEDTKEKPMYIELNKHQITGIKDYTIHRETNNPYVELQLNIYCLIKEININKKANLK